MEERANAVASFVVATTTPIYHRLRKDVEKNATQLLECAGIIPLMLIYAYETRIMIALIVLFLYVYIALQQQLAERVRSTTADIRRAAPLYLVLFLWFLLSKIWSGPSYAQDCIWLQPQIEWILFFSVLIQNVVLLLPPHPALDFLWMFNYVYPERSMISTCATLGPLMLRAVGLTVLWVFTTEKLRVRTLGLFLVNSWYGVPFFGVVWFVVYVRNAKLDDKDIL